MPTIEKPIKIRKIKLTEVSKIQQRLLDYWKTTSANDYPGLKELIDEEVSAMFTKNVSALPLSRSSTSPHEAMIFMVSQGF